MRRWFLITLIFAILLSACSAAGNSASLKMAPVSQMPDEVRQSSSTVQEAYQFAVANPDVMQQIPCYCGCGSMGHTSNYACYVKDTADGKVTAYDLHATGCSICVDITRDTMRMMKEGKTTPQIRAIIDQTYSKYGPSNITK